MGSTHTLARTISDISLEPISASRTSFFSQSDASQRTTAPPSLPRTATHTSVLSKTSKATFVPSPIPESSPDLRPQSELLSKQQTENVLVKLLTSGMGPVRAAMRGSPSQYEALLTRLATGPLPPSTASPQTPSTAPTRRTSDSEDEDEEEEDEEEAQDQESPLKVGDRCHIHFGPEPYRHGTLRFLGKPHFADGIWAGIQLDQPEGKNDGAVRGKRYFKCKPKHGAFVQLEFVVKDSNGVERKR
eukprot:m.221356 g.221356  ORF g.221356 m.221356 type:complete len:245 (+) comp26310_c2_seq44:4136-4870(+)